MQAAAAPVCACAAIRPWNRHWFCGAAHACRRLSRPDGPAGASAARGGGGVLPVCRAIRARRCVYLGRRSCALLPRGGAAGHCFGAGGGHGRPPRPGACYSLGWGRSAHAWTVSGAVLSRPLPSTCCEMEPAPPEQLLLCPFEHVHPCDHLSLRRCPSTATRSITTSTAPRQRWWTPTACARATPGRCGRWREAGALACSAAGRAGARVSSEAPLERCRPGQLTPGTRAPASSRSCAGSLHLR